MVDTKSTQSTGKTIYLRTPVDLGAIAGQILDEAGRAATMDLILALDEEAADLDFTVTLRDKLNEAIAHEDPNYDGLNSPTAQFLHWLVAMDDPEDEQGTLDRQVVTLSQIIGKARDLLGGA
jgi:hypothetical protein